MRVAWAAAGAAGLAYWFTREEASVAWFAILVGCVTALVLGFWWVAETGILLLSPTARFKSTLACVEELAGKFERRAEDGDRRRFLKSVHEMHRLSNRLATVQVYITTTETESDDPEAVAHAARKNRDELLRIAPLAAEGDLAAARERTGS